MHAQCGETHNCSSFLMNVAKYCIKCCIEFHINIPNEWRSELFTVLQGNKHSHMGMCGKLDDPQASAAAGGVNWEVLFPIHLRPFFRILVWIFWTRNVWRHLHVKISCLKPYTQTVARCWRLSQGFPQGSICEFKWPTSCPSFALFPFDWWVNHESGILGEYKARDEGRSIQSHMAKYLAPWAPPPPHQSYLGKKRGSSSHRFPPILPRKRISIWFH